MVALSTIIGIIPKPLAMQLAGDIITALINRGDLTQEEKDALASNHEHLSNLIKKEQDILDGKG